MKVITPDQMASIEEQAYREGASTSDFMEEAGSGIALIVHDIADQNELDRKVILLCGKGNNAGDAYVAGIQLLNLEYEVTAYQLFPMEECSDLCRNNHFSFQNAGGFVYEISSSDRIEFPHSGIIVDGIFGTGFKGSVKEPIASFIKMANSSKLSIVAVDIPSGLNGATGEVSGEAIIATTTGFLGLPKLGFFLRDGWNHVGKLLYVDFGIDKKLIDDAKANLTMLSPDILKSLMPPLVRNRHKYQAGHVVGLAGSKQLPGAGLLASLSTLCSGTGITHLLYPEGMENALSSVPYELIKVPYKHTEPALVIDWINRASAAFIGPGLGNSPESIDLLKAVFPQIKVPTVLDADALNIIAEESLSVPPNAILTPHIGELKRLLKLKEATLNEDLLKKCQKYAKTMNTTLIVKGGPTFIFHPDTIPHVNPKGDPGMATAGSGDVLTGLLASLLSQGLQPLDAAKLGVYLHGIAGEFSAEDLTSYCMTASDIIAHFPDAFRPQNWIL